MTNFADLKSALYTAFSQCRHLLENRLPPINSVDGIDELLDWLKNLPVELIDPDLEWIKTIAKIGNSSDGQKFEKLVRRTLIKLGFTNSNSNPKASLDPEATGGPGGLDFYCEAPYPVVGECKASSLKKIPTDVCSQLTYLAQTHLSQEQYDRSIRIIIGVGSLNDYSDNVAKGNKMNLIRPETLQRLVEFKSKYPGAINLLKLKDCLEKPPFGEDADCELNNYIDKINQQIKLRSHIVQAVKQLCKPGKEYPIVAEICTQYNAKFAEGDHFELDKQSVYELLLELSSPLTGYLGREKENDGSDRFYFLRDLSEKHQSHNSSENTSKLLQRIVIIKGDITKQQVDAIVNPTNRYLQGGGGVDGAIHNAAGSQLLEECRKLKGCETGEAKLTKGYNLPAKWVIHTVGPVWQGGHQREDELLAKCYRNSLELAEKYDIKTIAFASISTGTHKFPIERACRIAVSEVKQFLQKSSSIQKVKFVCFSNDIEKCYLTAIKEIIGG